MELTDPTDPHCGGCAAAIDGGAAGPHAALRAHEKYALRARDGGEPAAAEAALRCAIDRYAALVREPAAVAGVRMLLGEVLFGMGEYASAEEELAVLYHQLSADPARGPAARLTGEVANSLGVVCKTAGRLTAAAAYYQVAREVFLGGDFPDEAASVLHNLAGLGLATGAAEQGLEYGREGLRLRCQLHGPDHPLVAADRSNLSGLLHAVGLLDEAAEQLELAIAVFRDRLGPDHPEIAVCLSNLASIAADRGDAGTARRRYQEALDIKRRAHGELHPDTLTTSYNLGRLLAETGDTAAAAELVAAVVAGLTGVVADDHRVLVRARELHEQLTAA